MAPVEIGIATAQLFIAEGAKVVVTGRRQEAIDEYNDTASENTFAVQADIKDISTNKKVF